MDKIKQLIDDTPKDFAEPNFRLCFKINQLQNGKPQAYYERKVWVCSEKFNALNFEVVKYIDQKGQARTMYNMTKDGFTLLAMGFTGKKALFGVSFLF